MRSIRRRFRSAPGVSGTLGHFALVVDEVRPEERRRPSNHANQPKERPDAYSDSECLRQIYAIAYPKRRKRRAALENDAEWSLCLAFSLFALQDLLKPMTPKDFRSKASRIGVVVGFDGGDFIKVGSVTKSGLVGA